MVVGPTFCSVVVLGLGLDDCVYEAVTGKHTV